MPQRRTHKARVVENLNRFVVDEVSFENPGFVYVSINGNTLLVSSKDIIPMSELKRNDGDVPAPNAPEMMIHVSHVADIPLFSLFAGGHFARDRGEFSEDEIEAADGLTRKVIQHLGLVNELSQVIFYEFQFNTFDMSPDLL